MDIEALLSHEFPAVKYTYSARDASLYALTVGFGQDPMDARQLQYVYGDHPKTTASMALVMANPGFWQKESWTGIDWVRCLLGEQRLELHRPLPASGTVIGQLRVTGVADKGKDFGALLYSERSLKDASSGELLATLSMVTICRGDGGFGGVPAGAGRPLDPPDRAPDAVCELATLPQQALLFDLHGIVNPVHSLPSAAREAGHDRPFLHGICTLGFAHHALARELADYDGDGIRSISARFKKVVYPGETLVTEIWTAGSEAVYRVRVKERGVIAVAGVAQLADSIERGLRA
ncbi:MaoC/PaaZ C-terminal domain-containing protein [Achromobacter aegrifaciens]